MGITLRLPKDLHEDLHRIADREYRTLTAQITLYLQQSVQADRVQQGEQGEPETTQRRRPRR